MEMRVSSYTSREELDRYCELLEPEQKEGLVIAGTLEELKHYGLGPLTSVHGIPCRATDAPAPPKIKGEKRTPPKRLKGTDFGLNGRLTEHFKKPLKP